MIMNRMQDFVMSSCKDFSQRPLFQPLLAAPRKGSDYSIIYEPNSCHFTSSVRNTEHPENQRDEPAEP